MGPLVMRQVIDGQGAVYHMQRVFRREWGTHRFHAALASLESYRGSSIGRT